MVQKTRTFCTIMVQFQFYYLKFISALRACEC